MRMIRSHLVIIRGNSIGCAPSEYSLLFQAVDDTGRKTIWKRSFSKKTIWKRSFSEKTIWKRSFSEKTIWKRSFSMKTIWKRSFSEKTVLTQNDDLGLLEEMSRCLMPKEKLVVPENKSHSPIGNDCVSSDKYVLINQISFRLEVFRLRQYRTFQRFVRLPLAVAWGWWSKLCWRAI